MNDVFRLAANIEREASILIVGQIRAEAVMLLERIKNEPVDLKNIGIRNITYNELLEVITRCSGIGSSKNGIVALTDMRLSKQQVFITSHVCLEEHIRLPFF